MRAGQLRHRVTLEQRATQKTRGIVTEAWGAEQVLWANVEPLAGRELERARTVVANATHKVTMRYRSSITARSRLVFDKRTLNIESVRNVDERNHELILTCVEQS